MKTHIPVIAMTLVLVVGCGRNKTEDGAPVAESIGAYNPVKNNPSPATPESLKFSIPYSHFNLDAQTVLEISSDGVLRFEWAAPQYFRETQGFCLAFLHPDLTAKSLEKLPRILRAKISALDDQGAAPSLFAIDIPRSVAADVSVGDQFMLFAPDGAKELELQNIPDAVAIDLASAGKVFADMQRRMEVFAELSARVNKQKVDHVVSKNNLKQIGLAMHNYHDTFNHFPPAVTLGPDGTPWHSWRVYLLPYLDQASLYNEYKFDEPWDGANNRHLLDKMPDVYRVPGDTSHYTHYVVPTSREPVQKDPSTATLPWRTAFSAIGSPGEPGSGRSEGGTTFRDFLDGTSNSILAGTVDVDKQIPWMKPQDLEFEQDFTKLGDKGGFATPYMSDNGDFGLFLLADGSVSQIQKSIAGEQFRRLLTIDDGYVVEEFDGAASYTLKSPVFEFNVELDATQGVAIFTAIESR